MAATGQTINDRLNAVRYALAGQGLARTVCKATTEEVLGPKKKHMDYLLACTDEPNVSIPQLANLLIDRSQHTSWAVVFKSLITIHHLMNYGNERFTQYLATSNHSFELNDFMDRTTPQGYNMSTFVRRYAKYINDKISSYKTLAIDLCKIKPGKDNALRTMNMENLTKTLPVVHLQFDSLLDFDVEPKDLNNGVIMAAFRLLYKDLNRIFAAYQEAIINLVERYFKLSRKKTREALAMYKKYLDRIDKLAGFFRVVEQVGLDKNEMPDTSKLTSLLGVLEEHLAQLEAKKRGATPASPEAGGNADDQAHSSPDKGQQAAAETTTETTTTASIKDDEKGSKQEVAPATTAKVEPKPKTDDPADSGGSKQTAPKGPPASLSGQQPPKKPPPARPSPKMSPSEPKSAVGTSTGAEKKAPPERPAKPPSRPPPPAAAAAGSATTAAIASPAKVQAQVNSASPTSKAAAAAAPESASTSAPAASTSPAPSPTPPPHPPPPHPHPPQTTSSPVAGSENLGEQQKSVESSTANANRHDNSESSGPEVDGQAGSGEPDTSGDTINGGGGGGGCAGVGRSTANTLPSCSDGTIDVADIAREPQEQQVPDTNHVSSNHIDELPDLGDDNNNTINNSNNDESLPPPPPPPPIDEAEFEVVPGEDGPADGGERQQEVPVVDQNHQESHSNDDGANADPDPPPPID